MTLATKRSATTCIALQLVGFVIAFCILVFVAQCTSGKPIWHAILTADSIPP